MNDVLKDLKDVVALIKEPKGWEAERSRLKRRQDILHRALGALNDLKG